MVNVMKKTLLFGLCTLIVGCGEPYEHKFKEYDCVKTITDGQIGMVISTKYYSDSVQVEYPLTTGSYEVRNMREQQLVWSECAVQQ